MLSAWLKQGIAIWILEMKCLTREGLGAHHHVYSISCTAGEALHLSVHHNWGTVTPCFIMYESSTQCMQSLVAQPSCKVYKTSWNTCLLISTGDHNHSHVAVSHCTFRLLWHMQSVTEGSEQWTVYRLGFIYAFYVIVELLWWIWCRSHSKEQVGNTLADKARSDGVCGIISLGWWLTDGSQTGK